MKENKQEWLFPEVGESIEYHKLHEIGRAVSEGDIYPVPNIVMDETARKELPTWPIEVSSRRIVINNPFSHFAQLEPEDILDFKKFQNIDRVEFQMKNKQTAEMKIFFKNGEIKSSNLVLREDGKVQHVWA